MNILILFSQPWRVGGAETHVQALMQGLRDDHKITLAVNEGSNQNQLALLRKQYPAVQILTIQARGVNIFRWAADILKLTEFVKNNHIEIISAQQRTAGIWAYIIKRKTSLPFVVTMHDSWHRVFAKRIYPRLFPKMLAVSHNLAQRLRDDFGFAPDKITTVHNGIDFEAFTPQEKLAARNKLNLDVNTKIILHVSRLSSIKGEVSLVLLKSIAFLAKQIPDGQVIIIGEGPLRPEIEKLAQEINMTSTIKTVVQDFTADIKTWYAAADLVVAEGRVAIEAIACLRPVVAIRNGRFFFGALRSNNIMEAINVNFDGQNLTVSPAALAEQIAEALTIDENEKMDIFRQVKSRMNINVMAEEYLDTFQKSIEGSGHEAN